LLAGELDRIARQADAGGLDTLWVSAHLLQGEPGTDPSQEMLEAYTVLGHLSAVTERIRLGVLVSPVTFREPALLVKAVTTLDVLSGGMRSGSSRRRPPTKRSATALARGACTGVLMGTISLDTTESAPDQSRGASR